jgi:SNF2 family DNA or RNA helicase
MYSMRHVEMTPEQKRIYKELKDNATAELTEMEKTSYVTALSVVSRMLRLHQVLCGHVVDEEGVLREIKENRTDELIRLLREYDGKAIIWCNYDYNVRKVSEALRKEFGENSVSRFWGGNNATREQEEYEFQNDPERLYMVGTQSAGGRGRMWAVANLTVYYSNQNNLEHRSQSEERAQAVGKTTSVGYVDLLVPGTVDERIIYSLRDKIDMAATISGDNWREWLV